MNLVHVVIETWSAPGRRVGNMDMAKKCFPNIGDLQTVLEALLFYRPVNMEMAQERFPSIVDLMKVLDALPSTKGAHMLLSSLSNLFNPFQRI